jgi:endo-1,4-beta-xylanase
MEHFEPEEWSLPHRPTRRTCLLATAGLVLAATGWGAKAEAQGADASLARVAAEAGRYYGSAVRIGRIAADDQYREAILRECAYLTPESEMKWDAVERRRGEWSLAPVDDLMSFARANGMKVRGHTLLWHRSVPDWADDFLGEHKDWSPIRNYFSAVISRYGDEIDQWDVVNEPIDTGHRMDGLRENVFLKAFGPDYIRRALDDARMLAPRASLMINEYGLDYDFPVERDRRYLFLKLLEGLRSAGAPLDAVGVQGHLDLSKGPFSPKVFGDFLQEIANLGLEIIISELDVKEYDYRASPAERDRRVAEEVKRYLDVAFAQPAVKGLTSWGLSDRYSWLEVTADDYARYPGVWKQGDGPGVNRGLPLDSSMRRKPMYRAIEAAFRRAPLG